MSSTVDRLSEDCEGFCKIMDRAPYFEVNADISHYNCEPPHRRIPGICGAVHSALSSLQKAIVSLLAKKLSGNVAWTDRGIKKGPHLARINERVNHTHQRMAREHGDLSSDLNIHFSTVSSSPRPPSRNGRQSAMLAVSLTRS